MERKVGSGNYMKFWTDMWIWSVFIWEILLTVFAFGTKDNEGDKCERKRWQQVSMEFRLEKAFRVGTRESKGKFVYLIYDYLVFEGHFMVTTLGFLWILFWNSSYCEIALKFTHEAALGNSTSFVFYNIWNSGALS